MSISDLRSRMRHIPGIETLTMRLEGGRQVFTIAGVSASAGAFASDSEIEAAIEAAMLAKVASDVTEMQAALTARLPPVNITEETKPMTISGFQPGAIKAAIDAAQKAATERRAQSMAKLAEAGAKAVAVSDAIDAVSAKMAKEADDALQELAGFTNGGPE